MREVQRAIREGDSVFQVANERAVFMFDSVFADETCDCNVVGELAEFLLQVHTLAIYTAEVIVSLVDDLAVGVTGIWNCQAVRRSCLVNADQSVIMIHVVNVCVAL